MNMQQMLVKLAGEQLLRDAQADSPFRLTATGAARVDGDLLTIPCEVSCLEIIADPLDLITDCGFPSVSGSISRSPNNSMTSVTCDFDKLAQLRAAWNASHKAEI